MTKRGATSGKHATWGLIGAGVAVACSTTVADLGGRNGLASPDGGKDGVAAIIKKSEKLDLLLVVDNSISMAPQLRNLDAAIPDFVRRLLDEQPSLTDVHVGLITTSLGARGADTCPTDDLTVRGESMDDHGALIGSRPRFAAAAMRHPNALPTSPEGFVSWSGGNSTGPLAETVTAMVEAAGWQGCDWESPLEAMYRFLVEPEPPLTIEVEPCTPTNPNLCSRRSGVDDALLSQRAAFLRPDSVVAIALFTDEDDCSIRDTSQGFYLARSDYEIPRATAACSTNPYDPCCYNCATGPRADCPYDPTCDLPLADSNANALAFRCTDQKRKFGIDFRYPVARYTNALTQQKLCTLSPDTAADETCIWGDSTSHFFENPLFSKAAAAARDPSMVYLLGVVGVPRADLLTKGGDAYRTAAELTEAGTWDAILGTPRPPSNAAPIPPTDALMLESREPRQGTDGQGIPLAPPGSGPFANPQNGHEHTDPGALQAACLVPLAEPSDCATAALLPEPRPGCDCGPQSSSSMNPVCQNPPSGVYDSIQRYDQVHPTPRQLELLKSLGDNGVTTSLCSPNFSDTSRADYGYREAAAALAAQMKRSVR